MKNKPGFLNFNRTNLVPLVAEISREFAKDAANLQFQIEYEMFNRYVEER